MIQITQLGLARGSTVILREANLTLFPQEKVGLVGHNGAGKSTLFSAIIGDLQAEQGSIQLPGNWTLAWIDQEVTDNHLTVLEFALQGDRALSQVRHYIEQAQAKGNDHELPALYEQLENLDGYAAESRVASILHGLGFKAEDLQRKVGEFSGGWKMRLNLAKVLGSRADLILLDEPTNHLDIEAVVWLEQWIKQVQSTVLVISHDRDFLDAVCTHTVHLHQQTLTKYTGGYSAFERAFAERAEQANQANKKASAEAQKLQRFVDRFKAKASKAKQAQSRVKRLEKIKMIETLQVDQHISIPFLEPHKSPDPLVVLSRASCGYQAHSPVLDKLSLEIRPGDRIGLLGANGNGKTTLVKSLVGELQLLDGERVEGKGLVYGYFAQDQIESLDMQATPLEHLARLDRNATEQQLRDFLARFQFRDDKVKQTVNGFSGGEKSRLALALIAYLKPNLLLLDEPTNHLDIATRQALASSLLEFEGALVMVSHDRHLLESITDTYWRVHGGEVKPFDGDLQDYADTLRQEASQAQAASSVNLSHEAKLSPKGAQADRQQLHQRLKQLKNEFKKLEAHVEKAQARLKVLDAALAQIDYSNGDSVQQSGDQFQERERIASSLTEDENRLLEAMIDIESLEEQLGLAKA
ncbi:ATP-binding cassette domain-containing protein [Limnobacter sp.]|uniref:ATP-binding cassette domain-containing protein n=1 Tax=Limnobacter sp. TaxID=2003368 RepID=UPI003516C39C